MVRFDSLRQDATAAPNASEQGLLQEGRRRSKGFSDSRMIHWLGIGVVPFVLFAIVQQIFQTNLAPTFTACVARTTADSFTSLVSHALFTLFFSLILLASLVLIWSVWADFSMRSELSLVLLLDVAIGAVRIVYLVLDRELSEAHTEYAFRTLLALRVVVFFLVSFAWPLHLSLRSRARAPLQRHITAAMTDGPPELTSLDAALCHVETYDVFAEHMAVAGGAELLDFYVRVELYKVCDEVLEEEDEVKASDADHDGDNYNDGDNVQMDDDDEDEDDEEDENDDFGYGDALGSAAATASSAMPLPSHSDHLGLGLGRDKQNKRALRRSKQRVANQSTSMPMGASVGRYAPVTAINYIDFGPDLEQPDQDQQPSSLLGDGVMARDGSKGSSGAGGQDGAVSASADADIGGMHSPLMMDHDDENPLVGADGGDGEAAQGRGRGPRPSSSSSAGERKKISRKNRLAKRRGLNDPRYIAAVEAYELFLQGQATGTVSRLFGEGEAPRRVLDVLPPYLRNDIVDTIAAYQQHHMRQQDAAAASSDPSTSISSSSSAAASSSSSSSSSSLLASSSSLSKSGKASKHRRLPRDLFDEAQALVRRVMETVPQYWPAFLQSPHLTAVREEGVMRARISSALYSSRMLDFGAMTLQAENNV